MDDKIKRKTKKTTLVNPLVVKKVISSAFTTSIDNTEDLIKIAEKTERNEDITFSELENAVSKSNEALTILNEEVPVEADEVEMLIADTERPVLEHQNNLATGVADSSESGSNAAQNGSNGHVEAASEVATSANAQSQTDKTTQEKNEIDFIISDILDCNKILSVRLKDNEWLALSYIARKKFLNNKSMLLKFIIENVLIKDISDYAENGDELAKKILEMIK